MTVADIFLENKHFSSFFVMLQHCVSKWTVSNKNSFNLHFGNEFMMFYKSHFRNKFYRIQLKLELSLRTCIDGMMIV